MSLDPALGPALERLYAGVNFQARVQRDPVRFPRRYADPEDAEIAALLAAGFAYGRLDLFVPVLEQLFTWLDDRGGPRAAVLDAHLERDSAALGGLVYRWTRGRDVALLLGALRGLYTRGARLRSLFEGAWSGTVAGMLEHGVGELRVLAVDQARSAGLGVAGFAELPLGLRNFLPLPSDGSACKRWNMLLRWMVRPAREGVDLGLWPGIPTSGLLMPLDVHTARFGRWLGLVRRRDEGWATAEELTAGLRAFDPVDPVRFDFALAHLGISGGCPGGRKAEPCARCPLDPCCGAPPLKGPEAGR